MELRKGPLVNDGGVACVLEQARLYKWLYDVGDRSKYARPERRGRTTTHLEDEPTPEIDTAHLFGTIRKSRGKGTWGVLRPVSVSTRERSKKAREGERTDEHSLGWQRKGGGRKECGELK